MLENYESNACSIPGCRNPASPETVGVDGVCDHHLTLASPRSRERFAVVMRRLAAVQTWWDDEERYDAVVASDRYLKLSHATCCATEAVDAARERLMLSIFAAQSQAEAAPAQPTVARAQPGRSIA